MIDFISLSFEEIRMEDVMLLRKYFHFPIMKQALLLTTVIMHFVSTLNLTAGTITPIKYYEPAKIEIGIDLNLT